jgi:hypothetical protein
VQPTPTIGTEPPYSWSHRRKLARAEFHIKEVKRLIKEWTGPDCYEIAIKPDGQGGSELVGTLLKALPNELGLVIGDALQALRSSLDNLAFALACKNKPSITADEEEDVSFPIYDTPPLATSKSIRHLSGTAQTDLIGLCAYPARGPKEDDPLWLLNKTNNRDKHRVITVAVADVSNYGMSVSGTFNSPSQIGIGGPKRCANVGDRNIFSRFGPGSQMQMNVGATLQIVFGEGLEVADREVPTTLRWFHDHIRDTVFQTLEKHL